MPNAAGRSARRDLEHAILRGRLGEAGAEKLMRLAAEDAVAFGLRRVAELRRRIEQETPDGPARAAWHNAGLPEP
jgi:hypothetical protein